MRSPYADKDPIFWTAELESHFDDLHELQVDFSVDRDVSVEFAGSPRNRSKLVEHLATQGWEAMAGIGTEPHATVILVKTAAWSEESMLEAQAAMLNAAGAFECVFEGLCYHFEPEN